MRFEGTSWLQIGRTIRHAGFGQNRRDMQHKKLWNSQRSTQECPRLRKKRCTILSRTSDISTWYPEGQNIHVRFVLWTWSSFSLHHYCRKVMRLKLYEYFDAATSEQYLKWNKTNKITVIISLDFPLWILRIKLPKESKSNAVENISSRARFSNNDGTY